MPKFANAGVTQEAIDARSEYFSFILDILPQPDFDRTITTAVYSLVSAPITILTNTTPAQYFLCAREQIQAISSGNLEGIDPAATTNCGFMNTSISSINSPNANHTHKSILGISNAFSKELIDNRDAIPINMQVYAYDYIQRTPLIGKSALAQSVIESTDLPIGTAVIYDLWKIARNIAYGMLSIIMLVIGGMIMLRKKIDQQTAVTVQYAIPRLIIAVLLIAFSWPIIALTANLMFSFTQLIVAVIGSLIYSGGGRSILNLGAMQAVLYASLIPIKLVSTSFGFSVLILCITMIFSIIVGIVVTIKAFFIYVKLALMALTAPFELAVGILPGKEDAFQMFFKKLAVAVISFPSMYAMIALAVVVAVKTLTSNFTVTALLPGSSAPGTTSHIGNIVTLVGAFSGLDTLMPLIFIFGLLIGSMEVPKKVEEFIVGPPKRK